MKKTFLVSVFLFISLILTGCNSQANSQSAEEKETPSVQQEIAQVDKIEIIDFHSTHRCFSCQTIEQFTQLALAEFFQPELSSGKITFQSINVEEGQNQPIVQKFQARGSSLFINVIRDGKDNIEEDTQVWRLVQNEAGFKSYLKAKIANLLK